MEYEKLIWNRKKSNRVFTNPRQSPNNSQGMRLDVWAQVGQACITSFMIVFSSLEGAYEDSVHISKLWTN